MTSENGANRLLLGIDLGTSRTIMMSNRGAESIVNSVVGYPKDLIAVKLLGGSHVFGEEAVEKRSYLTLYSPLEKGVLKEGSERDIEAARELIKHVVSLADPEPGDKVCGIIGVPARASFASKGMLLNLAQQTMDIALVLSEPFIVAYELGELKNSIIIDIGAGTTDVCGMKGTIPGPDDQVTILKGGNYIDEALETAISDSFPDVQVTRHLAKTLKEKYAFVGEASGPSLAGMRSGGKPVNHDITEEIRSSCEMILPDILEQVENIVMGFDPEDQEKVLKNIYLAGGGSNIKGLDKLIMKRMSDYGEVVVKKVSNPDLAGCAGALKLAVDLPPKYWSQLGEMIGG